MVIPSTFEIPGLRLITGAVNAVFLAVARAGHLVHFFRAHPGLDTDHAAPLPARDAATALRHRLG